MACPVLRIALVSLILAAPVAAHDVPPPRGVSVSGEGEVRVEPDRARLSLGVEVLDPDLRKGESEVNRIVREFVAAAKELGTRDEHLSTTGVGIQPEYVWPQPGKERQLSGYRVSRQIELTIVDLDKLGDFLLAATRAGINQVLPPALEHSRAKEFEQDALARAAEHARAKAARLAAALGARLGPVRRIDAVADAPAPVSFKLRAVRAEAGGGTGEEMGLATGQIVIRASATAEFELVP